VVRPHALEERIRYLDWITAKREAEVKAWRAKHPDKSNLEQTFDRDYRQIWEKLDDLRRHRRIEFADREPLAKTVRIWLGDGNYEVRVFSRRELYDRHLDSPRWKRTRLRKLVSVGNRCEYPGCEDYATDCHHLHYDTLGFEENADLEALCRMHHRAQHPGWW
jgi:hypothetical protein